VSAPSLHPIPACWCRASGCSRQVPPGAVLCGPHARTLERISPELLCRVLRIDPRGVEFLPANIETLDRMRTLADTVEHLAALQGRPIMSHYRARERQIAAALEARTSGPAVQGRLLEEHPDTGAYGAQGRER
jgi:hypothetical protein